MKNKKIAAMILIAMLSSVFVMAIPTANADGDTSEITYAGYFDGIIDVSGYFGIGYADSHTEVRVMSGATTVVSGICITDSEGFFSVSIKKEGLEAGVYGITAISHPVGKPSVTLSEQMEVFETESISLNVSEKILVAGSSFRLEAETIPATVHYSLIWSSADPSKVSVDDEGNITAISEGETKIKVTLGNLEAECTVIVTIKAMLSKTDYSNELFDIAGTFGNHYGNTNVEVQILSGTVRIASGMCISENDGSFSVSVLKKDLNPGDYDVVAICQPVGVPSLTATASMSVYKITWSVDGTETDECYSEGLIPEYKGDTEWIDDAGGEHIITGWAPTISEVTGDFEYEAVTGNRVTFDSNGGTGSIDDVFVADGDKLDLPTQGISRAAHILAGWSLTPGGIPVAGPYTVTSDTVLYAVWTPVIYEEFPSEGEFADLIEQEEAPVLNVKGSATDTVLSNDLFKDLNKPLVVNVLDEEGEIRYSWSFDGNYKENVGTLKLGISETESNEAITSAIGKLDMENPLVLNFAASGELPNDAVISYRVSGTYEDGTVLNLLFFNEETGELELQAENLVVSDGMVSFGLTHCSIFVLAEGIPEESPADDGGVFSSTQAAIILAAGIVIAIAAVFLIGRSS